VDLPTIEGFRILEELGSGALSTVYKAVEEPLGRTVALKVLKATIAPSSPFASQLEREARVLGSCPTRTSGCSTPSRGPTPG
jgi:serine/threonine protein kinase